MGKKLYYEVNKCKGNTFDNNINKINKLFLGLGLKTNDVSYIYVDENYNKTYSAANCFSIKTKSQKNDSVIIIKEEEKTINYPISLLYNVFFYNNIIFYLEQKSNELNAYKLDKENLSVKKCVIQRDIRQKDSHCNNIQAHNETENNETKIEGKNYSKNDKNKNDENIYNGISYLKIEKNVVELILKKLEGIIDDNNIKRNYEILCDILEKYLDVDMNLEYPKPIKEELSFEINNSKFHQLKFIS